MPFNIPKQYAFTPSFKENVDTARLNTANLTRARLSSGGTFFRSKQLGSAQNSIALTLNVTITQTTTTETPAPPPAADPNDPPGQPTTSTTYSGYSTLYVDCESPILLIKDRKFSGSGNGKITFLEVSGTKSEDIVFTAISSETFNVTSGAESLGTLNVGVLFRHARIKICINQGTNKFEENDIITIGINAKHEEFHIETVNPPDLRALVQTVGSSYIEMKNLSEDTASENGADSDKLSPFTKTFLSGGDGLPYSPLAVRTGPGRAIVRIWSAENDFGSLGIQNIVYEWIGEDPVNGSWQRYL